MLDGFGAKRLYLSHSCFAGNAQLDQEACGNQPCAPRTALAVDYQCGVVGEQRQDLLTLAGPGSIEVGQRNLLVRDRQVQPLETMRYTLFR